MSSVVGVERHGTLESISRIESPLQAPVLPHVANQASGVWVMDKQDDLVRAAHLSGWQDVAAQGVMDSLADLAEIGPYKHVVDNQICGPVLKLDQPEVLGVSGNASLLEYVEVASQTVDTVTWGLAGFDGLHRDPVESQVERMRLDVIVGMFLEDFECETEMRKSWLLKISTESTLCTDETVFTWSYTNDHRRVIWTRHDEEELDRLRILRSGCHFSDRE